MYPRVATDTQVDRSQLTIAGSGSCRVENGSLRFVADAFFGPLLQRV